MLIGLFLGAVVTIRFVPPRYRLVAWILVIIGIVFPWQGFQTHSHWAKVRWIPFVSPPVRFVDIVGNALLYIPFGFLYATAHAQQRRAGIRCIAWALLVSGLTEATQIYSHTRIPAMGDVVMNVLGGLVGYAAATFLAEPLAYDMKDR